MERITTPSRSRDAQATPARRLGLAALMLAAATVPLAPAVAGAQGGTREFPAVMVIDGVIRGQDAARPRPDDPVLVLNAQGVVEGTGSVVDERGGFFVQLSKAKEFNGTPLSLRLRRGKRDLELLKAGVPFRFRFASAFPVGRLGGLTLDAGAPGAAQGGATAGSAEPPAQPPAPGGEAGRYDVDGDHRFTAKDVEFVKGVLAGRVKDNGRADTNNDRTVNARDLVEIIRAYKRQQAAAGG